jgi:anti-sigma factor NepR-like protein
MHMDAQARKSGGRLSREDQRRLGDILQRVYDDVLRQGVPDRFRDLLNELDEHKEVGGAMLPPGNGRREEGLSHGHEADRLVPHNKGSG